MEPALTTMDHTHVIVQEGGKIKIAKKVLLKAIELCTFVEHNDALNSYPIL
jgi:hypothetical protein